MGISNLNIVTEVTQTIGEAKNECGTALDTDVKRAQIKNPEL
jgi:hypothetical protein